MTVTDAEAAQRWAKHRGLDLNELRLITLGQVAWRLQALGNQRNQPPDPIPAYVVRTLADLERQDTRP